MPRLEKDRRGFALIAAMGLMVLLGTVALEVSLAARYRRLAVANGVEMARAWAAADAGVAHANALLRARIDDARSGRVSDSELMADPWGGLDSLVVDSVPLGSARYAMSFSDIGSRLNLNAADEATLRRFMTALRIDAGQADRLAQRILDWRDADQLHRARGAEREEYLKQNARRLPADGPFDRIEDLRDVLGMTLEVYQLMEPHVTVQGSGRINITTAPRPVLLSLPGMTETTARAIIRRREAGRPFRNLDELANALDGASRSALLGVRASLDGMILTTTQEVSILAVGWVDGSPVVGRVRALVARGGSGVYHQGQRRE